MVYLVRTLGYALISTVLAGILATIILSQTLLIENDVLIQAVTTVSTWSLMGFFVYGLTVERWQRPLQRLERSQRAGYADLDQGLFDIRKSLHYPIKTMFLNGLIWIAVVFVGLQELSRINKTGTDAIWLAGATVLTIGGWAWTFQLFLNRKMVLGVVEQYLTSYSEIWELDDPLFTRPQFPLRAKWLMLSLFVVGVTIVLGLIYSAGAMRHEFSINAHQAVVQRLDAILPLVSEELIIDNTIPSAGMMVSSSEFKRSKTVSRLQQWIDVPFWVIDDFGQLLYSSDPGLTHMRQNQSHQIVGRSIGRGYRVEVLPVSSASWGRVLPNLAMYAAIVAVIGMAVLMVAILVGRDVSQAMAGLKRLVSSYNEGDFREVPPVMADDDTGFLSLKLNEIRQELSQIMGSFRQAAAIFDDSNDEVVKRGSRMTKLCEDESRNMHQNAEALGETLDGINLLRGELDSLLTSAHGRGRRSEQTDGLVEQHDRVTTQLVGIGDTMQGVWEHVGDTVASIDRNLSVWREYLERILVRSDRMARYVDTALERAKQSAASSQRLDRFRRSSSARESKLVEAREQLSKVESNTDNIMGLLDRTNNGVDTWSDALSWVNEIGDDTRLLSMNAQILSAQAEQEGRSFSVIARNIEDLANTSDSGVESLQAAMTTLSTMAQVLDVEVHSTKTTIDDLVASFDALSELDSKISSVQKNRYEVEALLREQMTFLSERIRSMRTLIQTTTQTLVRVEASVSSQRYQFDEINEMITSMLSRISEWKGHAQYQVGRANVVQTTVEKARSALRNLAAELAQTASDIEDLKSFGGHLIEANQLHSKLAGDIYQSLNEFDDRTRTLTRIMDTTVAHA